MERERSAAQAIGFGPGVAVVARDGTVGTLVAVEPAGEAGGEQLLVETADGRRVAVPTALVDRAASTPQEVVLTVDRESVRVLGEATSGRAAAATGALAGARTDLGKDARLVIPVHEEELVPTTREVELGRVRVRKRVETVPAEATIDVAREEIHVERVAVNREVEAAPEPRWEGETLIVPVVEEMPVVVKRLVLREEVRLTRRRLSEPTTVRDTARREVVEIEQVGPGEQAAPGASAPEG